MTIAGDYVTAVDGHLTAIGTSVDGVAGDVGRLKAKILELENSPDRVTPEDQARITASLEIIAGLETKVKALDDLTAEDAAPEPPTEEPPV